MQVLFLKFVFFTYFFEYNERSIIMIKLVLKNFWSYEKIFSFMNNIIILFPNF